MKYIKPIILAAACAVLLGSCSAGGSSSSGASSDSSGSLVSGQTSSHKGYIKPASTSVITLPAEDSGDWALFLVNNYFSLPSSYSPKTVDVDGEKKFHAKAADDFNAMVSAAKEAGDELYIVSTYRTIEYQRNLFENNVKKLESQGMTEKEARAETAVNIQKPARSEHNTGLAADLVSADWYQTNTDLTEDFENTEAFKWLSENCYKYGFILRYPKGKEDITEITYEPWHYRYVGRDNAEKIYDSGLCLEEYMQTVYK